MWDSPGFLFSPPRLLFRCRELGREEAALTAAVVPASDPRSLLTLSGSSGCVARGLAPGSLVSPRLLFRCLELGREQAAPPASDPRSLQTLSGSLGCVARGLEPGRLVSEPSGVLRSGLLLVLLAQSEPEDEELRLVLAP